MKKLLFSLCAVFFLALSAVSAHAADVTGKWTADMQMPGGGDSMQLQFVFAQDGAALTGSVQGPQGDAMAITDGKIDGDKISFKVSFNGMTISHEGTVNAAGDEIKQPEDQIADSKHELIDLALAQRSHSEDKNTIPHE